MIHTTGLCVWCEYMKVVTFRNGQNLFSWQIDLLCARRMSSKTNKVWRTDVANDRKLSYSAFYVAFIIGEI